MAKLDIALVTPWCGEGAGAGADALAFQLARGLTERGHSIDVLTTGERSFSAAESDVTVRRFKADEHDGASTELIRFLESHRERYGPVICLPYLYAPALQAAALGAERTFLQPLLHDEPHAYRPSVEARVHDARGLLFGSEGEYLLARRLYGPGITEKSHVTGRWIEPPPIIRGAERIGSFNALAERYILYLGRRDESKNIGVIIEAYRQYRSQHHVTELKLVLAGPGSASYDAPLEGIVDLGFVTDIQKHALLAHALALFQPSANESFSRALMEAWAHGRPVVVNEQCLPTALTVGSSGGGWMAASKADWRSLFQRVDHAERNVLEEVGGKGQAYYEAHATRDRVLQRYEDALASDAENHAGASRGRIYHVLAEVNVCDDRSRRAFAFDAAFRRAGFASRLHVSPFPPADVYAPVILHSFDPSSSWCERAERAPLGLTYSERSATADSGFAALAECASLILVDSPEYADDVSARAGGQVQLLPPHHDATLWDVSPDRALMSSFGDEVSNLLFVGPLSPASCCPQLLAAFSFLLSMQCNARLIVADSGASYTYVAELRGIAAFHGLTPRFILLDRADVSQLAALYRTASVFWSMSEAENGLSALFDAMAFDVPVLAYATSKVKDGLRHAGLLFTDKSDPARLGALAKILIRDQELRRNVLSAQRVRRQTIGRRALDPYVEGFAAALGLADVGNFA